MRSDVAEVGLSARTRETRGTARTLAGSVRSSAPTIPDRCQSRARPDSSPEVLDHHQVEAVPHAPRVKNRRAVWRHGEAERPEAVFVLLQPPEESVVAGHRIHHVKLRIGAWITGHVVHALGACGEGGWLHALDELSRGTAGEGQGEQRRVRVGWLVQEAL